MAFATSGSLFVVQFNITGQVFQKIAFIDQLHLAAKLLRCISLQLLKQFTGRGEGGIQIQSLPEVAFG